MRGTIDERLVLEEMEPRWAAQGYTVVREPTSDLLPDFLGNFRPDAVATGRSPGIIIEIVDPRNRAAKTRITQLARLFAGREDWKLEVLYTPSEATELSPASRAGIESALTQAEQLAEVEPRAALMLAWAGLEALGRTLHPSLTDRGMSTGTLIDLLISNGNLDHDVQQELRRLGQLRNRIAHGQLDLSPASKEVRRLVELARLLREDA